jgi:hypothetical protein
MEKSSTLLQLFSSKKLPAGAPCSIEKKVSFALKLKLDKKLNATKRNILNCLFTDDKGSCFVSFSFSSIEKKISQKN